MLAFDRLGSGPPLVLLHGTTSSRGIWKPLLGELARDREVVAVDLPAHGESSPTSFTPLDWAKEVVALLDHIGMGRVSILGHSSGGWTALEIAKLGRANAVLALAPAGLWRKHSPLATDAILNRELAARPAPRRASRHTAEKQGGTPHLTPADIRATSQYFRRRCDRCGALGARLQALSRALQANPPAALHRRGEDPTRRSNTHHLGRQGSHCA